MKLKSIFNMSQLDCSDSRIEEGSQEFHKLYKLGGVLGKGGFGTVFTTIRKKDKLHVVVKEVYKAKIIKKIADGKTPLEVALMQQVLNTILLCNINSVLHRYIKDENVLIHRENLSVKMIDFGSGTYHHNGLYNEFEGESFPL